ncbi:MAG: hypothetical protein GY757_47375, partial [bacterium]|nr:hypothetical protein [bacterium]
MKIKTLKEQPYIIPALLMAVTLIAALALRLIQLAPTAPYLRSELVISTSLALLSLIILGIIANHIYKEASYLFIVPLLPVLNGTYPEIGRQATGVTIIATLGILILYYYQLKTTEKDTRLYKSIIPGIIVGMLLNAGIEMISLLPVPLLMIIFYSKEQKATKILLYLAVIPAALLLTVPLSFYIFEPYKILGSAAGGKAVDTGGIYAITGLIKDLGLGTAFFVVAGIGFALKKELKKTVILLTYPLLFVIYKTVTLNPAYKADVVRLYPFYALFAAVGILQIYGMLQTKLKNIKHPRPNLKIIAVILLIILFFIYYPVSKTLDKFAAFQPDSRQQAVQWLQTNAQKKSTLVIPTELEMDLTTIPREFKLYPCKLANLTENTFDNPAVILDNPYYLIPTHGQTGKNKITEKQVDKINRLSERLDIQTTIKGHPIMVDYIRKLPQGNPQIAIGTLKKDNHPALTQYKVWNPAGRTAKEIAPTIKTITRQGKFNLQYAPHKQGAQLKVTNTAPNKKRKRHIIIGIEADQKGFKTPTLNTANTADTVDTVHSVLPVHPVHKVHTVHFIVQAAITPQLKNNT